MTRGLILGIGAGLAVLLWTASPVHAGEPVIVAPALTEGDLAKVVGVRLETRLREVVLKSDLEIVEVSAKVGRAAAACEVDSCRAELITASGAKFLLVPEITLDDKDYHLRLTLYAASGGQTARLEDTCSLCGLAEAADLMGDLGARLGRKVDVATRAAFVEIRTEPAGAKVFVADELVGTTPLEVPLDAGVHQLRIELDGYIGLQRSVDVVAGESAVLDLGLQPAPPKPPIDRAKLFGGIGWAALAVGAGAVAGGATLMVLDERPITSDCSGANVDVDGKCRWRHATLEGGIGLFAGGAVLIGTGIALLVVARRSAKSPQSARAARLKPTLAGFALRF